MAMVIAITADPAASAPVRSGWTWPLQPVPAVVHGFRAPPSPWSPGHRGVDLTATAGQAVLAPSAGRVVFAGTVVDRGVLTVQHPGGLRTSYEPVHPLVPVGAVVAAGQAIAVVESGPGHCSPASCLHWGVRRGDRYIDPLLLVRAPEPPVLLPLRSPPSWHAWRVPA